ncbi:hypothetical protein K1728_02045 [Weissella confusa]|uniref:hypothetical protein n=1 Tax=Weissella confusa TaxID=1583 RepID=UPI001C6F5F6A|nr:hypothetical protein [Weissella confusa]QYU58218.1 hypothetical protein K1728_02045 [Weissella confusa]
MDKFTFDMLVDLVTKWSIIIGAVYGMTRYIVGQLETRLTKPLETSVAGLEVSVNGLHEVVSDLREQVERHEQKALDRMDRHNSRITAIEREVGLEEKDDKLL